MLRLRTLVAAATIAAVPLSFAGAQGDVRVRAGQANWGGNRTTVTAPFFIANQRGRTLQTVQRVALPPDWRLLMGQQPQTLQPGESTLLMIGANVPSRAAAGVYVLNVLVFDVRDERLLGRDSIIVIVPRRRALEVAVLDRPRFVVSGKSYEAGFVVRNRGNTPTDIVLKARSSLGQASLPDTSIYLASEESRVVRARVHSPSGMESAMDDVLELTATEADTTVGQEASARVTVVPEPNRKIEEYVRIPAQIRVRAANTEGVSPYEAFGGGKIRDGSDVDLDFLFRGPAGNFAVFGDRDEYRAELRAPNWRLRGGDQLYMLSSLTSSAQPGFGGGVDGSLGAFSAGAYGQEFRRLPQKGTESGAFIAAHPFDTRLALNVVDRQGGSLPGRIGSATFGFQRTRFNADLELARNLMQGGTSALGWSRSARVSYGSTPFSFDLAHIFADTAFVGSQRGSEHDYLTTSVRPLWFIAFGANVSTHHTDLSHTTGVPYTDRLDAGNVSTTLLDRLMIEAGAVQRVTDAQTVRQDGRQKSLRAHLDQDVYLGVVSLEGEVGRMRSDTIVEREFTDASVGLRRSFSRGTIGGWAARYSGGSLTKGASATDTYGGDASLRLTRTTELMVMGYATRVRNALADWHSQLDGQISQHLPNGATITLRARLLGGDAIPAAQQNVAYLEYGMPLRLPVSRLRTPGRVYGRVVDATSGRGVPGALVRLGPQVAITDNQGQVAFGGVPAGEHRLSMSQETSFANAVFVGDPTVRVDGRRRQPTTFQLAVAHGARVDIDVHRYAAARTAVGEVTDSLVIAGPLDNAMLMLANEHDTLFQTTAADGKASFTEIPPGQWVLTIRGDTPAFHRFDPDRLELTLRSGETRQLAFRLVPRKREVQIIGEGEELRSEPRQQSTPKKPRNK